MFGSLNLTFGSQQMVSGESYTAEAQAYFDAMAEQPTQAHKTIINNRIKALLTSGTWTKLRAIWFYDLHNSTAGLINAKTPGTYNSTNNLCTHEAFEALYYGWKPTGHGQYLNTNYSQRMHGSKDTFSMGVWVSDCLANSYPYIMGAAFAPSYTSLGRATTGTPLRGSICSTLVTSNPPAPANDIKGLISITRVDSGNVLKMYRDKTEIYSGEVAKSADAPLANIYVGNTSHNTLYENTNNYHRMAYIGINLLVADIEAIYNTINDYSLGV